MGSTQPEQLQASVIVPVRNGAHFLRKLIPMLERQTIARGEFEVIIADDGSTDDPLKGFQLDEWLRVSRGEPQTEFAARNRGASIARGRAFAFIDVDCQPEPDWLECGLRALESADVVAGAVRFLVPAQQTVWTLIDIDTTKNQERHVHQGFAETANLFVSRQMFEQIGGFDPAFPFHGDFDFAQRAVRAGGRLAYAEKALAWHPTRDVPRGFIRMAWGGNRWYAARVTREGERPRALKLREWVPIVQTYRGRRRAGQSSGLDRAWFAKNGLQPSLWDNARALPFIYVVLPYMGLTAQLVGYRDGRKLRSSSGNSDAQ